MLKVIIKTWPKSTRTWSKGPNTKIGPSLELPLPVASCHHPSQILTLVEFRVILSQKEIVRSKSESMASGWGITGNKGRCYDFWMDFSECMSRCREPKDCSLLREDYLECLHHSKEVQSNPIETPPPLYVYILKLDFLTGLNDIEIGISSTLMQV